MRKILLTLLLLIVFAPFAAKAAAEEYVGSGSGDPTPPYPDIPAGDYEIAYDDGDFVSNGWALRTMEYGLPVQRYFQVVFQPPVNGLLHEVRIAWYPGSQWVGTFHLEINDTSSGQKVTTGTYSNLGGQWQVIDVSSYGFVTSGEFRVYVVPDTEAMAIYMDEDRAPIEHPGVFYQYIDGVWYERCDSGVRVTITPTPGHVIPEMPLGTITATIAAITALALFTRRTPIKP